MNSPPPPTPARLSHQKVRQLAARNSRLASCRVRSGSQRLARMYSDTDTPTRPAMAMST